MQEWYVQVPLSQLVELKNLMDGLHHLQEENKQMKARLEALHRTQYDLMAIVNTLRKECQPKG